MKVIIVGGVAGGASAAARIRRLDEQAEIIMFERSGYISYANCGLPYFVGGVITNKSDLTLQTPESFYSRFRIDVRVRHEVTEIYPDRKVVAVRKLDSGETFEESYDKLVLAPGARAVRPPFARVEMDRLFTLRTVEDTMRIHDFVESSKPRSAVIVGGGYIGIEIAENLRGLGMDVTIVEMAGQLMSPLDPEMAALVQNEMRANGVKLLLNCQVSGLEKTAEGGVRALLGDDRSIEADMAVVAVGVAPDTALAKDAGLETGRNGSIVVNERMETSAPDVYAVGDAVQVKNMVTGEDALIALAGPANKQGRIAANNICGRPDSYRGSLGSSVIKVFSLTVACTGINEGAAKRAGIDCDKVYLSPASHASYYPGGTVMTMKVLFEKGTWKLLGAQIVGYDGVDKRIDVIATSICAGFTAPQLADLDLAYAPPYSSAKDPVNMAGFMAENIASGVLKQFFLEDIDNLPRDGSVFLLDARTVGEYQRGHVDGFVNIPVDELRERIAEVESGKPVYVICQSGLRSYIASCILNNLGYESYNFSGGYRLYEMVNNDRILSRQAFPCGMDR